MRRKIGDRIAGREAGTRIQAAGGSEVIRSAGLKEQALQTLPTRALDQVRQQPASDSTAERGVKGNWLKRAKRAARRVSGCIKSASVGLTLALEQATAGPGGRPTERPPTTASIEVRTLPGSSAKNPAQGGVFC